MKYFLLQFNDNQSQQHPDTPLSKSLQQREWMSLLGNCHNQTYGLIRCEESLDALRSLIEPLLAENARMFIREIQADNLPSRERFGEWLTKNSITNI
jgi:hypothetical protein